MAASATPGTIRQNMPVVILKRSEPALPQEPPQPRRDQFFLARFEVQPERAVSQLTDLLEIPGSQGWRDILVGPINERFHVPHP